MKISTKSKYGLRAMLFLASRGRCCSAREIATGEHIPYDYLGRLFMNLKRAGLVQVKRGVKGGYMLAGAPESITLGQIIVAMEGHIEPVSCIYRNCKRENVCLAKNAWEKINNAFVASLDSITLADSIN